MRKLAMLLFVLALCVPVADAASVNIDLKTAGSFGVLAGSGVTNAVAGTIINGDVGSHPTPAVSGLLPGDVNGILYLAAGAVVGQAKLDLVDAYNAAVGAVDGNSSEPVNLSGKTLDPNIYAIGAANFTAGNLTLNGHGDPNAQWIFHTTSITTASDFNVLLINSASASNVFWQVGTSATLGIRNNFAGNILAMTSITLNGTGTLSGRALARNGAVTISNIMTISVPNHTPSEANVPNVIDQNQADANAAIIGAGLVLGTVTNAYSDTIAEGNVISQNPVGGTAVAGGTDVNIVVSLGLPLVPNVVGHTQADANTAITAASFILGTVTTAHNDTVAAGLVISQTPGAGAARTSGTDVNIVVSLGLPLIPNVVGQTQADANTAITATGLVVGTITYAYSDTVAAGLVISQTPGAGAARTSGTVVNIVVSLGSALADNKAVLVYKLTTAINPVINYEDANGLEADVSKENLSAYVVFGISDAYDVNDINDANGPTVILFGKDGKTKFQKTLGGNEPNSFVNIRIFRDANSINPFEVTNGRNATATSIGIEFGDSNATTGFDIGTSLYGKNTNLAIGLDEKFSVAKSLKGQVWINRQFVEGQGAATATIDSKLTKDTNKNSRTVKATVANIKTTVLNTYAPVNVLP